MGVIVQIKTSDDTGNRKCPYQPSKDCVHTFYLCSNLWNCLDSKALHCFFKNIYNPGYMPCNISIYRNLVISQVNTNNINSPWQIFEIKNLNLAPLPKMCLTLFSSIMSTVQEKQFNVERINTTLQEKKRWGFFLIFLFILCGIKMSVPCLPRPSNSEKHGLITALFRVFQHNIWKY